MSQQPIGVQLVSIQTSPNDRLLWALDNRGSVFVRTGLSDEMPVGTDWELVPGTHLSHLCTFLIHIPVSSIHLSHLHTCLCVKLCTLCTVGLSVSQLVLSSRTVWVRCVNGDLARRYGISDRNPAGDYWKKIPGHANWLTGETGLCVSCVSAVLVSCVSGVSLSLFLTSVSPEDELWAVTLIGGLSRRLTKLLPQTPCRPSPSGPSLSGDDVDDEWELI